MKIEGAVHLNRPDLHILAAELGIGTRDVLLKDEILTIYNTSKECQEIIDDNALVPMVALTLNIFPEDISELKEVVEEPVKMEFDLDDEDEDDL
ncbi:hypothetical protein [Sulfurovum sp. TSL1]|uniref:hypothetical protein n=1 Tax=Sulfurovum sp. TSL1 TaxID=2826994 RepID=UPI001CC6C29E|nr:hypothetical protein [Sulfurovum sp. TSL1]